MSDASEALYQRAWLIPLKALCQLLAQGADPHDSPPGARDTTFLRAVRRSDAARLTLLLQAGARADQASGWDGRTALHLLAMESRLQASELVVPLVLAGARVQARDERGWTPLRYAVMHASLETLEALLDHGAEAPSRAYLEQAASRPERVALLLGRGAQVSPDDQDARSALHAAVIYGQLDVMRRLLEARASVDWRTLKQGHSALRLVVTGGALEAAQQLLLTHGADPQLPDHEGVCALMVATPMADEALVSALLERAGEMAARAYALESLRQRALAIALREDALVERMTQGGERFHVVTPGSKCEYDHEELVWFEAGRWWIESRDGHLKTSARREVTQALAPRRDARAAPSRSWRSWMPWSSLASLKAHRPEPRAGEAGS